MLEPLRHTFMQQALLGGLLVGFLASYFAPFVVQRRMAFLGSGLAHAAFGGVALGILLNAEPLYVAVPFTALVAVGIVWVREHTALAEDTTIGIFFAVSMALGVVILSRTTGYAGDAFTYLFGSLLAVTRADLVMCTVVAALSVLTWPLWRRWTYATFDRTLARADRVPVLLDDYILAVSLSIAVVVAIKVVGIVLMAAFFVLPGATARILARTFTQTTLYSVCIGLGSVAFGLYLAYHANLPSGPAVILLQAALFAVAALLNRAFSR